MGKRFEKIVKEGQFALFSPFDPGFDFGFRCGFGDFLIKDLTELELKGMGHFRFSWIRQPKNIHDPTVILFDDVFYALLSAEFDQDFWLGRRALASSVPNSYLGFLLSADQRLIQPIKNDSPFL